MKMSDAFKAIEEPKPIASEVLEGYLKTLYNDSSFTVKDASYVEDTEPQLVAGYKRRANVLVDELIKLSNDPKFEQLRIHFTNNTSVGETRTIIDEMKKTAETICFKLANDQIATPEKFKAEIKSATINACSPGALTNMQKILYSMDNSLYTKKYDYIQNLANEYVKEHKLSSYQGTEVHVANELIHEVSLDYKVTPPRDIYARYRDLRNKAKEDFVEQKKFKTYLDHHLTTREGVYSFAETIANDYLGNLPDMPKDGKLPTKFNKQDSVQLEKVTTVTDSLNMPITSIVEFSENGAEFEYKPNYISIIKAATMQQLLSDGIIEYTPLTVQKTEVINIPSSRIVAKDAEGKIIRDAENKLKYTVIEARSTSKLVQKEIIESPDGWYLREEEYAGKPIPTEKLLDTNRLKELTIDKVNMEDYLHEHLKEPLAQEIAFIDSLRVVIESNEHKVELPERNLTQELILLSDQAQSIKTFMTIEKLASLSNKDLQKWIVFMSTPESDRLEYSIAHGDEFMLGKHLEISGTTKQDLITWKDKLGLGYSALHLAAKSGNSAVIDMLREAGADLEAKDKRGDTALHIAAKNGNIEVMAKLKELGADLEAKDGSGKTALHFAAANGKIEVMAKLKELGADLEAKDKYGDTALHIAAKNGNIEVMAKLKELDANLNAKDGSGKTALHFAAANGKIEVISKLKELGADLNDKDKWGDTALHIAADTGKIEVIAKLKELGADVNAKDKYGDTALHIAAKNGKIEVMAKLKELGADLNAKDKWGDTALHIAAKNGNIEVMAKLKELGADLEAKDGSGKTALHFAAANGKIEVIAKLKELGADLNSQNEHGFTALHFAAANGNIEMIAKLKELGADLEAKDGSGKTALRFAAANGNIEVMAKLKELGADLNAKDKYYGDTALHIAARNGNIEVMAKLKELGVDLNSQNEHGFTALYFAAENGKIEVMAKLKELGADLEAKNGSGKTALHFAAKNGNTKVMFKLIENGANLDGIDINAKDGYDYTALHFAAQYGNIEVMAKLKELGADLEAKDAFGYTALHFAAQYGNIEVMAKLKELGADLNAKGEDGDTALHYAAKHDRTEAIAKLIEAGADVNVTNREGETPLDIYNNKQYIATLAKKLLNNKENKDISKLIINLVKQASGYLKDDNKIWYLAGELVKQSPEEDRVKIVSEAFKDINYLSRKERLLSFVPDNQQTSARSKMELTCFDRISSIFSNAEKVTGPVQTPGQQKNQNSIDR
jgi:ankyrin repeat protein